MPAVILDNLVKTFRDARGREVRAVDGVSLAVEPGELLVLVGPSGCGKSTLLRLVAGLEVPDAGQIHIADRSVADLPPADRDVAMVFQNYALFPHLTVFENMALGLRFRKYPRKTVAERVRAAAGMLKLETLLERKPGALSGGQRQRVALGRAIVRQPAVFLLDEPMSNLDAQLRGETRTELARLHRRLGATMLLVTHDQTEAMTLGQRLCVLQEGRVVQLGSPQEVYQQPRNAFVAGFLGSPGMNLIRGIVHAGGREMLVPGESGPETRERLEVGPELALRLAPHTGKELVLGIRPEHLAWAEEPEVSGGWPVTVELVEPLGHEQLVHVKRGAVPLVLRQPAGPVPARGEARFVRVPSAGVHLFAGATGERLVEQSAGAGV